MAVDFNKLRSAKQKTGVNDPVEIFRRLPKPFGINDLYTSQDQVLRHWFANRQHRDTIIKLHTGGGKTLVALLIGQSTLAEQRTPVLYLVPTVQLVAQVLEQAKAYGIPAVGYEKGQPLDEAFLNANAILVATYKALFNGRSKFGIRGTGLPQSVGAVILDDAHAAFAVVRDSFTLEVRKDKDRERFNSLTTLFRKSFRELDRLGTFDSVVSGGDHSVLEVPYWAWHQLLDAVRAEFVADGEKYALVWPLLRDNLHLCHALISKSAFTVTSILPLIDMFPTFSEARRRVYVSATIPDDSEIIRTFGMSVEATTTSLSSRSLAGIGERMILIPSLMPFKANDLEIAKEIIRLAATSKHAPVILTPSGEDGSKWEDTCDVAEGTEQVNAAISRLRDGTWSRAVALVNRYDGIDLAHDACRVLVMDGLPRGASTYEVFRANSLYGSATMTRMLAQRIEQGIGRGSRGSGDFCIVLLVGTDLSGWVAREANFPFLTAATRAQIEMGSVVSREISSIEDLVATMNKCVDRDQGWTEYHAESLAELIDEEQEHVTASHDEDARTRNSWAAAERKALELWRDGYHENAIARIERLAEDVQEKDREVCGWLKQFAARIADNWGNSERAAELQRQAFARNRNLTRPKIRPPYVPLAQPGLQAGAIVAQIGEFHLRRGLIQFFEEVVSHLHHEASANQFEQALVDLARLLGLVAERRDENGEGPDVLWLLPSLSGWVIEAKSRKKGKNPLTKEQHGQLLVAGEWFDQNYPKYQCIRVSVHPENRATKAAVAAASYALTYEKLGEVISDARVLLSGLCESQLSGAALEQ
ncbi:MAG TPA: DEAD/DEAH box helicase, partial [Polyangiaceae bacterium]